MIKVTLDTNILISGTFWNGDSFKIMNLIDNKKIESILSKEIIKEYIMVMDSDEIAEKVEHKDLVVSKVIQKVMTNSKIVDPKRKIHLVIDDPDDDKFIETAVEGRVDYIISNDKHLLKIKEFEGIKIVKADEFLNIFEQI
ncbi:MAG: putative toxin-antitoxin system toxin component, PIN family [Nanoarchaeota archaeon]|nr:putative toxin-antitoxin system toxin component, PIN family [Nanoarchaeota archaeon]